MEKLLLVAAGGAAGAVARYGLGGQAGRGFGQARPYGHPIANVLGGLFMGLLVGSGLGGDERSRLLLGVGVLGGFTTFSAFSLETVRMLEARAYAQAGAYAAGSVILSVGALFVGLMTARRVFA